jgi:nucleoside 2-deoxyribosyltransferase
MQKVYLAGPTVFLPDADERFARMKKILSTYGLAGKAPVDNQAGLETLMPGRGLGEAINDADESLMDSVDAAIFNTDPFRRGTEMDAGTAFEVGYCRARGIPMAAWRTDPRHYPETVKRYMETIFQATLTEAPRNKKGGTSGQLRDPDGVLVHSDGYYQNLMIDVSIRKSGGETYADENWEKAFDRAAVRIAKLLESGRSHRKF